MSKMIPPYIDMSDSKMNLPNMTTIAATMPKANGPYSMQQAIEEGFILDVLQNYTTYKLAFKLANRVKEWDEKQVEHGAAMKGLMRWVRLHPYNISQKVKIVVEHYRENVAPLLDGNRNPPRPGQFVRTAAMSGLTLNGSESAGASTAVRFHVRIGRRIAFLPAGVKSL